MSPKAYRLFLACAAVLISSGSIVGCVGPDDPPIVQAPPPPPPSEEEKAEPAGKPQGYGASSKYEEAMEREAQSQGAR